MGERKLTIVEHLGELRSRIIKSAIFIIICSCLVYNYVDIIFSLLVKFTERLVFIAPQEAFITNIKIAFFGGLFLSLPFVLYQVWRFVYLGLEKEERKYILIFGIFSFILFILGAAFGYFVIVPIALKFLLGFATDFVTPMITVSKYISFVGTLTFAFGLIFQLPLIILFLTKIHIITPHLLSRRRREAVVFIFIIAAILTSPDVITQILMALPLILLYELGIVFSRFASPSVSKIKRQDMEG